MNTTYYVGIATHIYTDEFYVFKRKLPIEKTVETDFYYGSGSYIRGFSKKYLKKFFSIDIIEIFYNNETKALQLESDIINNLMSDNCMNRTSFTIKQVEPKIRYNSKPVYINNILYKSRSYASECLNISKAAINSAIKTNKRVVKSKDEKYYIIGKTKKILSQETLLKKYKKERSKVLSKARLGEKNSQAISLVINNIVYGTIKEGCNLNNIDYVSFIKVKNKKQPKYQPKNDNRTFYFDYSGPVIKVTIKHEAG